MNPKTLLVLLIAVAPLKGQNSNVSMGSVAPVASSGSAISGSSFTLTNGGAITDPGTGAVQIAAAGTNQSVTIAASGTTGEIILTAGSSNAAVRPSANGVSLLGTTSNRWNTVNGQNANFSNQVLGAFFDAPSSSNAVLRANGGSNAGVTVATGTGNLRFNAYGAGTLTTDSSGNVTATSDENAKIVVRPFTRGLVDLAKIKPITWRWRPNQGLDEKNEYSGLGARNVRTAIPEAVSDQPNGQLGLQDRPLIAALVNSVNELADRPGTVEIRMFEAIAVLSLILGIRANTTKRRER